MSWPPSFPAKTQQAGGTSYGWGDWFLGSIVSSFVAWPVVFATDTLWAEGLLPLVDQRSTTETALLATSLIPKAAASFLGAHWFLPKAHWFYKLTLLPALPLSVGISMAIQMISDDGSVKQAVYDDWLPMAPSEPSLISTSWRPSAKDKKSMTVRLCEAAPRPLQIALEGYMPQSLPPTNEGGA